VGWPNGKWGVTSGMGKTRGGVGVEGTRGQTMCQRMKIERLYRGRALLKRKGGEKKKKNSNAGKKGERLGRNSCKKK